MPARLIRTGVGDPIRVSAIDEAVLDAVVAGREPATLHVYRRAEPTVSVGRFAEIDAVLDRGYVEDRGIAVVRRISAGGAIYTDEATVLFGLADPDLGGAPDTLLARAGRRIAEAITARYGVEARFVPDNDVHVAGRKVCGMAVGIRRNVALLHGAFLVEADAPAMAAALGRDAETVGAEVAGLAEVVDREVAVEEVETMLVDALSGLLDDEIATRPLTETEEARVRELVDERYGNDAWTYRR